MIQLIQSAFGHQFVFKVTLENTVADINSLLSLVQNEVTTFLSKVLEVTNLNFKVLFEVHCQYVHEITREAMTKIHSSSIFTLYSIADVNEVYDTAVLLIKNEETEFFSKKSQWTLISCDYLIINLYKYLPFERKK